MKIIEQIRPFLEPKSIALLGISRRTGREAFNLLETLQEQGYQGKLYPVNPNTDEILGVKTYPEVSKIPDPVDLAVIFTPREVVPDMVRECANNGIKALVIVGQGFADAVDDKGKKLQADITAIIRETGIRIVGPNTIGTANSFLNFTLSFAGLLNMEKIPVGLVSQSGLVFGRINELNMIGKGIDLGNCCDVDLVDCLEYFEADPDIKVIALHIEGIKNGRRFLRVAKRVARKKPVVVLKTGRSRQAARAVQSHTGSIIGKDEIWDAVFKQTGLIRAETIDEMSDLIKLFSYMPVIAGRGVGIVSFSGGLGILTIDACEKYGLDVIKLSPEIMQKLTDAAPSWFDIGNPLDVWPVILASKSSLGDALKDALYTFMEDPGIDSVLLILPAWMEGVPAPQLTDILLEIADAFPKKAMVLCPYEGWVYDINRHDLEETLKKTGKVAILPASDRAAKALCRVAEYSEFLQSF